jgi:hypothetical protein
MARNDVNVRAAVMIRRAAKPPINLVRRVKPFIKIGASVRG